MYLFQQHAFKRFSEYVTSRCCISPLVTHPLTFVLLEKRLPPKPQPKPPPLKKATKQHLQAAQNLGRESAERDEDDEEELTGASRASSSEHSDDYEDSNSDAGERTPIPPATHTSTGKAPGVISRSFSKVIKGLKGATKVSFFECSMKVLDN